LAVFRYAQFLFLRTLKNGLKTACKARLDVKWGGRRLYGPLYATFGGVFPGVWEGQKSLFQNDLVDFLT
jgi:hypothetical protein